MIDYFLVAIPIIALAVNMIVQLLTARTFPQWGYLMFALAGLGAGFISLFALGGLAHFYQNAPWQETAAIMLVNLATYVALAFCFFFGFVNPGKTSIRVRLFRELEHCESGLSIEQILALYNQRRIIELRLERLLTSKQVIKREGRYYLNGFSLWFISQVIHFTKKVVTGKESEFSRSQRAGPIARARENRLKLDGRF
jgi:hypothetical protein